MTYAQTNEEELIQSALDAFPEGTVSKTLLDIGSGDGFTISNTRFLLNQRWEGVLIDAKAHPGVVCCKVTSGSIRQQLYLCGIDSNAPIGVFSIDIDGIDWHIVRAMTQRPSVIVCEYNPAWNDVARTIPDESDFHHQLDAFYGASANAWELLLRPRGYKLVGINELNLVFAKHPCGLPDLTFDRPPHHNQWGSSGRTDWLSEEQVRQLAASE